jgi:acyl-CoA synthetase (NDP forming)
VLLSQFGIRSPRREIATDASDVPAVAASLHEPLVMKVLSNELPHKSDVGGVIVGLGALELTQAAEALVRRVRQDFPETPLDGLLLEEMHSGTELLLGMIRDTAVGPAVVLGAGGNGAELTDDTVVALPPIDEGVAAEMIGRLRVAPMLDAGAGHSAGDRNALVGAIVAFSRFVEELGDSLLEAEINPLVVLADGRGVLALDALVRLAK